MKRSVRDPNFVFCLFNRHRPIWCHDCANSDHIFIVPWCRWPAFSNPAVPVAHSGYLKRLISIHCTGTYIVSVLMFPAYTTCCSTAVQIETLWQAPRPAEHQHTVFNPATSTTPFSYLCMTEFNKRWSSHVCFDIPMGKFGFVPFWSSGSPYCPNLQTLGQDR